MGGFCAVSSCHSYYGRKVPGISYHQFPNDKKLCKEWIRRCKRSDKFSVSRSYICSLHFEASDFKTNDKEELLNLPKKKRHLKNDAIPTLNLHDNEDGPKRRVSLFRLGEKRAMGLRNSLRLRPKVRVEHIEVVPDVNNEPADYQSSEADSEPEAKNLRLELQQCKKINSANLTAYNKQQLLINQQVLLISNLKQKVSSLSKERKEVNRMVSDKINAVLRPYFTPCQINNLFVKQNNSKKAIRWTAADICSAIVIKANSKTMYNYLRKNKLPLPGEVTLVQWKSQVKCAPGLLKEVFDLLKAKAETMNGEYEKFCVLKFDEMAVDPRYCYDKVLDQVFGSHSKVQVAMLQSLKDNWKQPIYFDFDTKMSVTLLVQMLEKVEASGLKVVAVVNDMDPRHDPMWKTLNVGFNKGYFEFAERKIYVFCDVPSLLKLFRNSILDEGLYLEDGTAINKKLFQELLSSYRHEKACSYHISEANISENEEDRQSVLLASRLLSSRTSASIARKLYKFKESGFVQLVNDVFDVLNSRLLKDENCCMRSAYGYNKLTYYQQTDTLKMFLQYCLKMSFGHRSAVIPVQKCLIYTIQSLLGLYERVTTSGGKFLFTTRFNQDCMENYLSQNCGVGGFYDSPSPAELHNRLRRLVLKGGSDQEDPESKSGTEEKESKNGEYDSFEIFSHSLLKCVKSAKSEANDAEELIDQVLEELNKYMILGNIQVKDDQDESSTSEQVYEVNFKAVGVDEELKVEDGTDGSVYVAAYVANKCRNLDPSLSETKSTFQANRKLDWIAILAKCGLMNPTQEWAKVAKQLEFIFSSSKEIGKQAVVKTLTLKIREQFPNLSEISVKVFVITRLFIHLRFLNKKLMCQLIKAAQQK